MNIGKVHQPSSFLAGVTQCELCILPSRRPYKAGRMHLPRPRAEYRDIRDTRQISKLSMPG